MGSLELGDSLGKVSGLLTVYIYVQFYGGKIIIGISNIKHFVGFKDIIGRRTVHNFHNSVLRRLLVIYKGHIRSTPGGYGVGNIGPGQSKVNCAMILGVKNLRCSSTSIKYHKLSIVY